ncbi:MAG: phage portal protein [Bacteroidota bacterium]|nr:phage portal protein [Bacteroidota bacterium]
MKAAEALRGTLNLARRLFKQKANYRDYNFQYGGSSAGDNYIPALSSYSGYGSLYNQVKSWVFNAVSLRSEDVAKTKFRLYTTRIVKGIETIEEIYRHPVIDIITSPNSYLSWYDLLYITIQNMDIQGNFYWLKERDRMKVLRSIRPVFPKNITIIPDQENYIKCYKYRDNTRSFNIAQEDIIHFKHQKAGDLYYGQSILIAIADVININNAELQYQLESFNQPIPPVSLETEKDLGLQIARELQEEFREKYGGIKKISRVPVLDNGLKLNIHKRAAHELDFSQSRKALRDEILSAFRVPANKLGIVTDVNKANADAADYSYMANAIDPLCRYISIKLTQDFRQEFKSPDLLIQNDDVVPQDVEKKLKYYESGLKYKWLTVDEVRRMENYDPLE